MKLTTHPAPYGAQRGFSLVELMISITISLVILAGLSAVLVNTSRSNNEMAKSNGQIENGRFAVQVLESDIVHAGFWGEYVPQFDDLSWLFIASDAPSDVPDPCKAYVADDGDAATTNDWDFAHINNLLGIAVQSSETAPGSCLLANKAPSTDVLVVRHAATCIPGEANCEADTPGKLYFQSGMCTTGTWGTAQLGSTVSTLVLQSPSSTSNTSAVPDGYVGMTIRLLTGTGAGQTRKITGYANTTYTVTVSPNWATTPAAGTTYTIVDEVLSTTAFPLRKRSCLAADLAAKRKFESSIYYVRDYAVTAGDRIPTLVRSAFDPAGPAALAHQTPEALVEGIERFAVELGIDHTVKRCLPHTAVSATDAIVRVNPATCTAHATNDTLNTLAKNRGDGNADEFIRCTGAACTADKLRNVVATKIHLLVRNTEPTVGYTDTKTYCMTSLPADGVCPAASVAGPFGDNYKRHLFSSTIRLTTISGRRETP